MAKESSFVSVLPHTFLHSNLKGVLSKDKTAKSLSREASRRVSPKLIEPANSIKNPDIPLTTCSAVAKTILLLEFFMHQTVPYPVVVPPPLSFTRRTKTDSFTCEASLGMTDEGKAV
eukprot:TRINITY_DN22804_c0_g1_i1.p1 TRINITY_DN22804_c0_g1~~TRINITY_DN22804_c0_g1_i1.p1  ORF type:complete len:117 (-),score=6.64 TRINITY_DN22804_c0_g1_i1:185-535(-)